MKSASKVTFCNKYRSIQSYLVSVVILEFTLMFYVSNCDPIHNLDIPKEVHLLARLGNIFDFPFLCSIFVDKQFIGTCTIISKNYVFASVSNMDSHDIFKPLDKDDISETEKFQYVEEFRVFAATNIADPRELNDQHVEKKVISVAMIPDFNKSDVIYPQTKHFREKLVRDSTEGFEYNICFLEVEEFSWNADHFPIYLKYSSPGGSRLDDKFEKYIEEKIKALEKDPFTNSKCKIAGWHAPTKRLIYHNVMYVPRAACQQAYCGWLPKTCNQFPKKKYHVCFKSLFFSEPCGTITGGVLRCNTDGIGYKNFAVLTTSISCARSDLPSVYTTMPSIIKGYNKVSTQPYTEDKEALNYILNRPRTRHRL